MKAAQQGMALVIVIWILSLLSLMAGSFALTMRRESSVAMALRDNAEASARAESGLGLAQYMLQLNDPKLRWRADGGVYQILDRQGGETRVRIISESGKIDINAAQETQLMAVIKAVAEDSFEQRHLLNCILDWRDEDDDPRPHGAEKKQYRSEGRAYEPSNKPFQALDELQLVMGITEAIYTRIQPWITIYSGQSEVNLQAATPEVLQIISADFKDRHISDERLDKRLSGDQLGAEPDENAGGAANEENQTYTIQVEVHMDDDASAALEAVIRMQSQDFGQPALQVLDWRPNQLTQSLFANDMESRLITVEDEFTNNN